MRISERVRGILLVGIGASLLVSCGALFNSDTKPVMMSSSPVGATVIINGQSRGVTPIQLDLAQADGPYTVEFQIEGKDPMFCTVNRSVSAGFVILDVLGGLIPVIIDAATGSWYTLSSSSCNVTFPSAEGQNWDLFMPGSYEGDFE